MTAPARDRLIAAAAGALVGAVLAGLGIAIGGGGGDEAAGATPAVTTSTTEPRGVLRPATYVADDEIVLGPTVVVPTDLRMEEGEAILEYGLVEIDPPADPAFEEGPRTFGQFSIQANAPSAVPERWTLITADGSEHPGRSASVLSERVAFEVPEGTTAADVTAVRVDAYRVQIPAVYVLDIPVDDRSEITIDRGTTVTLTGVIEQADTVLVQFSLHGPGDSFSDPATGENPFLRGRGPGWSGAVGGTSGGGLQLTWDGPELPDPIPIEVVTNNLVVVERPVTVVLRGVES